MNAPAEPASPSAQSLPAALLDYFQAPGKYQLTLRQPALLFASIRDILQLASGRGGSTPGRDSKSVREAASFFIRAALLYPGADHYAVLGLPPGEAPVDLKERYRLLMRLIHPDFAEAGAATWPADAAVRVNRAYEVLSSAILRREYDEQLASLRVQRPSAIKPQAAHAMASRRNDDVPRRFGKGAAWVFGLAVGIPAVLLLMPRSEPVQLVQRIEKPAPLPPELDSQVAAASPEGQVLRPERQMPPAAAPVPAAIAPTPMQMPAPAQMPAPTTAPPHPAPVAAAAPATAKPAPVAAAAPAPAHPVVAAAPPPTNRAPAREVQAAVVPRPAPQPAFVAPPAAPRANPVASVAPSRPVEAAHAPVPPAVVAQEERPAAAMPIALATPAPMPAPVPAAILPVATTSPSATAASRLTTTLAMTSIPTPTLAEAQPMLSQLLQLLESGSGDQLLRLLDGDARRQPAAQALSRQYEQLVHGAHPVRLSQVEFNSEPRDGGVLLVTGRIRLHAGEPTIGSLGEKLLVRAEFAQRGGRVQLTGLSGAPD